LDRSCSTTATSSALSRSRCSFASTSSCKIHRQAQQNQQLLKLEKKNAVSFQEQNSMSLKLRLYYFDLLRDISTVFVLVYFHILIKAKKTKNKKPALCFKQLSLF